MDNKTEHIEKPLGFWKTSKRFTRLCLDLTKQNRCLMLLPLLSVLVVILIVLIGVPIGLFWFWEFGIQQASAYLFIGTMVVVFFCIILGAIWTQAMMIKTLSNIILTPQEAHPCRTSLDPVTKRLPALALYALIQLCVSWIFRAMERHSFLQRILVWILGALWSMGTLLVLPNMILGKKTTFGSLKASFKALPSGLRAMAITLIPMLGILLVFVVLGLIVYLAGELLSTPEWMFGAETVLIILYVIISAYVGCILNGVARTLLYLELEDKLPQSWKDTQPSIKNLWLRQKKGGLFSKRST